MLEFVCEDAFVLTDVQSTFPLFKRLRARKYIRKA